MQSTDDEKGGTQRRLFLDTLDSGAAENVIRHLSSDVRSIRWHRHLNMSDVLMLYSLNGVLATESHKLFNSFHSGDETIDVPIEAGIRAIVDNAGQKDMLYSLSTAAGASFKRLVLASDNATEEARHYKEKLCVNFPHVTELYATHRGVGGMLPSIGNRLHRLYILDTCRSPLDFAPCTQLNELGIEFATISFLQQSHIWQHVGTRLEKLQICFFDSMNEAREQLLLIRTHCPLLRDISIRLAPEHCLRAEVTMCYASYGAQLIHAGAYGMTHVQCRTVLNACPNVTLSLHLSIQNEHPAPALRVACTKLSELSLHCHYRAVELETPLAISEWSIMKRLHLSCVDKRSVRFVDAMFDASFLALTELEIRIQGDQDALFRSIARSTTALERLVVDGITRMPTSMNALVAANGNLSVVRIGVMVSFSEYGWGGVPVAAQLACIGDIFAVFSEAKKLRELSVSCDGWTVDDCLVELWELCRPFRRRLVRVEICTSFPWVYTT